MSNVDKIDIHRYNEVVHCNNEGGRERKLHSEYYCLEKCEKQGYLILSIKIRFLL